MDPVECLLLEVKGDPQTYLGAVTDTLFALGLAYDSIELCVHDRFVEARNVRPETKED